MTSVRGNVPSPSTAGVEANSSEPVNAYMLLDATPPAGGGVQREAGERTSYALEGLASELANHKGHRVEIVGQLLPRLPAVSGPKSPAAAIQRIAVQTVKMVSAQCESRPGDAAPFTGHLVASGTDPSVPSRRPS